MRILLLFTLFFLTNNLFAQDGVLHSNLSFHSTYERYLYQQKDLYQTDDYLTHFLATSPEVNKEAVQYIKRQMSELFDYFDRKNIQKKSPKRAAKIINEHLQNTYFIVEKEWSGFEDVFKKRTYNNTTATALLVLILEHFEIPYSLIQHPIGIDTRIHKKKKSVLLSSPGKGRKRELIPFQTEYINLLFQLNIIDTIQQKKEGNESIFHQYYMPKKSSLSPAQLTGSLYFIQAMRSFKARKYSSTIDQLYKAQMFLPLPRNQVMRQATLYQLAGSIDIKKTADIQHLFSLYETFPIQEIKQELLFSFRQIAEYYLHKRGDEIKYRSLFNQYYNQIKKDRQLRNKLEKIYFSELAAFYVQLNRTDEVLQYMDSLYLRWPENEEINQIIARKFVQSISRNRDYDRGIKQIEYQMNRYPFLRRNKTVQDCHLMYYSRKGRDYFENGEVYEGIKMLETFNLLIKKYGQTPHFDLWVKTIYIPASYFYFSDNSYVEARNLIKKALVFAPKDAFLLHRLELLENY